MARGNAWRRGVGASDTARAPGACRVSVEVPPVLVDWRGESRSGRCRPLLGPGSLRAFVATVIAGGIIALVVAIHRGRLGRTLNATRRLAVGNAVAADIEDPQAGNSFAYAPAIAIGATLAALGW